jgi:hypothetical protein
MMSRHQHHHHQLNRLTPNDYVNYYVSQSGNGIPIYYGARMQRGHGLGQIFGGLFRQAMPMLKRGLSYLGRQAVKTGAQVIGDVIDGQSFGAAAKSRVLDSIKETLPVIVEQTGLQGDREQQTGSGYRRKRKRQSRKSSVGTKRRKRRTSGKRKSSGRKRTHQKKKKSSRDIFSGYA